MNGAVTLEIFLTPYIQDFEQLYFLRSFDGRAGHQLYHIIGADKEMGETRGEGAQMSLP